MGVLPGFTSTHTAALTANEYLATLEVGSPWLPHVASPFGFLRTRSHSHHHHHRQKKQQQQQSRHESDTETKASDVFCSGDSEDDDDGDASDSDEKQCDVEERVFALPLCTVQQYERVLQALRPQWDEVQVAQVLQLLRTQYDSLRRKTVLGDNVLGTFRFLTSMLSVELLTDIARGLLQIHGKPGRATAAAQLGFGLHRCQWTLVRPWDGVHVKPASSHHGCLTKHETNTRYDL